MHRVKASILELMGLLKAAYGPTDLSLEVAPGSGSSSCGQRPCGRRCRSGWAPYSEHLATCVGGGGWREPPVPKSPLEPTCGSQREGEIGSIHPGGGPALRQETVGRKAVLGT